MDWLRWHHGTTTDRKWPRIAARADTSVAAVIAVWASLLEIASQATDRGYVHLSDDDEADLDAALGLQPDTTRRIVAELCAREMVTGDNRIAAWDRRQPKRERDEAPGSSTERVRKHREGKRATDETAGVTPCNATEHPEQPRGEERREDHSSTETSSPLAADASPPADRVGAFEGQDRAPPVDADTRARIAIVGALRRLKLDGATHATDDVRAYVAAGGSPEHLQQVAEFERCAGKGAIYVLRAATSDLTSRAPLPPSTVITAEGRAIPAARAGPESVGRQMAGLAALEGLKGGGRGRNERLADGRDCDGAAEARLPLAGPDTGAQRPRGDGDGMDRGHH